MYDELPDFLDLSPSKFQLRQCFSLKCTGSDAFPYFWQRIPKPLQKLIWSNAGIQLLQKGRSSY